MQVFAYNEIPTFFNKPIDKNTLAKTFDMTSEDLLDFMESQGLQVFVLRLPGQNIQDTKRLAPPAVQNQWALEFSENRIAGKFFSALEYSPFFNHKPTILIIDSKDKWTLLHEFMHFLYEKSRIDLKTQDANIFENQRNNREYFLELSQALKTNKDSAVLQNAIRVFCQFMSSEIELASLLTLEEISIEKTISVLFSQGKIKYLTAKQKSTADHYIKENYETLAGQLDSYFNIRDDLQRYLGNQKSPLLDGISDRLSWLKGELEKLVAL